MLIMIFFSAYKTTGGSPLLKKQKKIRVGICRPVPTLFYATVRHAEQNKVEKNPKNNSQGCKKN